jgi:uncharacterized membrane protein
VEAGERLAVFVEGAVPPEGDRRAFAAALGLPNWALGWEVLAVMPRLPSGKVDYARLGTMAGVGP